MPRKAKTGRKKPEDRFAPYRDSQEHLQDELKRLGLCIRLRLLEQPASEQYDPLAPFKGLVVSEQEIAGLLSENEEGRAADDRSEHSRPAKRQFVEEIAQLDKLIEERRAASLRSKVHLALPHLSRVFGLDSFEKQCLVISLAVEVDRKYERLFAYLQDDVTRRKPTVDLALSLLCKTANEKLAARRAFDVQGPIVKYRLLQMIDCSQDGPSTLLSRTLKLDDRIVNFLLGSGQVDARLAGAAQVISPEPDRNPFLESADACRRIGHLVRSHLEGKRSAAHPLLFYFSGPSRSGRRAVAESVCAQMGAPLVVGDVEHMLAGPLPFEEMVWLLGREAVLVQAALCLDNFDALLGDIGKSVSLVKPALEAARCCSQVTFLLGRQPWKPPGRLEEQVFIHLEFPFPDVRTRKQLWREALSEQPVSPCEEELDALAGRFRLSAGQIRAAVADASHLAVLRSPTDGRATLPALYAACRSQSSIKPSTLARRIQPKYAWGDIVLPEDQLLQLREICSQAKYRHRVYGEWGFDRKLSHGKGLNVLFSGPPGTGKTMAAEVVGNELYLELCKIDLSQVVSKYIGETEKNLDKVFSEAEDGNALLFFDEADALFGRRSEVKDAHDRYANIEIGYLLQKMEEYDGIAILATNARQHMDEAFVRRLQVIVEFPFPDEQHRRRIWEVVFPNEAPLDPGADFDFLAREVRLSGGHIKNIALTAAFYAAEERTPIQMAHLSRASRREFQKLGRAWTATEVTVPAS